MKPSKTTNKKKPYDFLIVGAGLSGASIARLLTDKKKRVLVIEKRDHVGGNIATAVQDGIIVHLYGPHIFHTSDKKAWDFFCKYGDVYPFVNSPLANYKGEIYHLPFNLNTFHEMWGTVTAEEAKKKIEKETAPYKNVVPANLEEQALKLVGKTIYKKLIKGYTEKQWGLPCEELSPSIIKRLPLRFQYNNNYFNDIYQGLPKGGYSLFVENLLKGIDVKLGVDYLKNKAPYNALADQIIYTGPLDSFFNCSLGELGYRSLRFETKKMKIDDYQSNPVVNYTANKPEYTRICEHKHFDPFCENHVSTIVTFEYPDSFVQGKEPYYPLSDEQNARLSTLYQDKAKEFPNVHFLGRLANYRYFDMDDTIIAAMELAKELTKKK